MDFEDELLGTSPGDHLVLFYRTDEELTERAGRYLYRALQDRGVAIALATPGHRLLFDRWLAGPMPPVSGGRSAR